MSRPPYTEAERQALAKRLTDAMEEAIKPILKEAEADPTVHALMLPAAINEAHVRGIVGSITAALETFPNLDPQTLINGTVISIAASVGAFLDRQPPAKPH